MNYQRDLTLTSCALLLSMVLFLNNLASAGTSGFQTAVTYQVGTAPTAVTAGDFNGDGKTDVAIANFGDANTNDNGGVSVLVVSVLVGNGDGTFQAAKTFDAGNMPESIAVSDFNGDGSLDIVAVSETVTVMDGLPFSRIQTVCPAPRPCSDYFSSLSFVTFRFPIMESKRVRSSRAV